MEKSASKTTELPSNGSAIPQMSSTHIMNPLLQPLPTCKPTPPAPLNTSQSGKYATLLSTVTSWINIPTTQTPLTDLERQWLTRECLLRYLRATKWSVPDATTRLQNTLIWRREYNLDSLTAEHISPENETGKQVLFGYDIHARPCLYLNPAKQNTKTSERQIQHLVFMLERTIDFMPPSQETLTLIINFKGSMTKNPSITTGKSALNILQTHYPERLGRALVLNVPWVVWGFFKFINPFIDPLTREKLRFDEPVVKNVPREQLMRSHGGDVDFEYMHQVYWPKLDELAAMKRAEEHERWTRGGKNIGESEAFLKGGEMSGVKVEEGLGDLGGSKGVERVGNVAGAIDAEKGQNGMDEENEAV